MSILYVHLRRKLTVSYTHLEDVVLVDEDSGITFAIAVYTDSIYIKTCLLYTSRCV